MLRPRPDPINRGQYRLWLIPSFISTPTARYREAVLTVEPLTKSVPPAVAGGSMLRPRPDPINRGQYRLGLIPSFISTPTARYREAVLSR
jgi:hypothetical protein